MGEYQGIPNRRNQVLITWELCNEPMQDGRPYIVSMFLTNSLNEKAKMRGFLESWRGRKFTAEELAKFDLENILGAPCMLNVIMGETAKAKVGGIGAMPKGMTAPEAQNAPEAYWIESHTPDQWDRIPKGIQKIIQLSAEWQAREKAPPPGHHFDDLKDDIPF